jgi:type I restriction enzyme, R subunit
MDSCQKSSSARAFCFRSIPRSDKSFTRWSEDVREIANALEEKAAIPMVREQLELIIELQTDEYWQDITTPMLEDVRKRLRSLVKFIDKEKKPTIYTDFQDLMGEETSIELMNLGAAHDIERFREKTHQFLKAHENDPVIQKLRFNEKLDKGDLAALQTMLVNAGTGSMEDMKQLHADGGLGLFVRSLIGLDRGAAKRAFDGFLSGKTLSANQIQFVNLVIDYLTQSGWMEPEQLYSTPFTDFSPKGVDGLFNPEQVQQLIGILSQVRQRASTAA